MSLANVFCVCFFRCFLCCSLDGETQIWLGDLRLAFWFGGLCFWFLCDLGKFVPLWGATWHWCDLTFIEPSVVKLDYGKVSTTGLSSFGIPLWYTELQEMI